MAFHIINKRMLDVSFFLTFNGLLDKLRHTVVFQLFFFNETAVLKSVETPDQLLWSGVLELMSAARERELSGEEQPVLVVSADGVSRAGVYCAVSYVRDQTGMVLQHTHKII
jgi:hypothetical protein